MTESFIIDARWIIPVVPARTCLLDHAIVVRAGRIESIQPSQGARADNPDLTAVNLPTHTVIPGLINAHGHAAMTLLRGYADDRELMDWLENHIWPAEARHVSPAFSYDGTTLAVAEMIRTGTTFAVDSYWFPDETAKAYADNHFRAQVCMPLIQFPNAWAKTEDEHLQKAAELHEQYRNHSLVRTAIAPHAPYTVTDDGFIKAKEQSLQYNVPIHLHLHETRGECEDALKDSGKRPFKRIDELGLMDHHLQTVHMTQLTENEIATLASSGAHVVHCPESNLKLASGFCPVGGLLDAGVNVCVGTDSAASNNNLDMIEELRTAALLAKGTALDPTTVDAHTALELATINGARMLGMADEIGSLEPGKAADLVAIDMAAINFQPMHDPVSQVVYASSGHQVSDVWISGKRLLDEGQFTQLDEVALRQRVQAWLERMQA